MFLVAAVVALLILNGWTPANGLALFATLGSALIGWLDDFAKISHARSLGLKARGKLLGQLVVSAGFIAGIYLFGAYSTQVAVPFSGQAIELSWLYPLFVLLIIFGTANGA